MREKLYNFACRKTGLVGLSWFLSGILNIAFQLCVLFLSLFCPKRKSMGLDEAFSIINAIRPNPIPSLSPPPPLSPASIDLSVIVPVYNVEDFLAECLESVLSQETSFSYELIVIDDGSTDRSGELVDSYKNDSRIVALHTVNRGPSAARNCGLGISKGKYIMFLDSDDRLDPGCIEDSLSTALRHDADIIQSRMYRFGSHGHIVPSREKAAVVHGAIPFVRYPGYVAGKCYRRELFNSVRFPVGCLFEDTIIHYSLFGLCRTFVCLESAYYGYRRRDGSIVASAGGSPGSLDTLWATLFSIEQAKALGVSDAAYLYKVTLRQFSLIQKSRLAQMDAQTHLAVFTVFASVIQKMKTDNVQLSLIESQLEKAFLRNNFEKWNLLCNAAQ